MSENRKPWGGGNPKGYAIDNSCESNPIRGEGFFYCVPKGREEIEGYKIKVPEGSEFEDNLIKKYGFNKEKLEKYYKDHGFKIEITNRKE